MGLISNPDQYADGDFLSEIDIGQQLGMAVVGLGAVTFFLSMLGCLSAKFMKTLFTVPFIILSFIIGIVMLSISLTMTGAFGFFDDIMADLCVNQGQEIANAYTMSVEHFICSQTCPCPRGENDKYSKKWWNETSDRTLIMAYRVKTKEKLNED